MSTFEQIAKERQVVVHSHISSAVANSNQGTKLAIGMHTEGLSTPDKVPGQLTQIQVIIMSVAEAEHFLVGVQKVLSRVRATQLRDKG